MGPLHEPASPSEGFFCAPIRGSTEGLFFAVELPENLPDRAVFALFRDGDQVEAIEVCDAEQHLSLSDSGAEPGAQHEYACGVWLDDDVALLTMFHATVGPPPPVPAAPVVNSNGAAVEVRWEAEPELWTIVFRRDVLQGGEAAPISPAIGAHSWVDEGIDRGGIYAYSLRAVARFEDIPWESEASAEQYIEVPAE